MGGVDKHTCPDAILRRLQNEMQEPHSLATLGDGDVGELVGAYRTTCSSSEAGAYPRLT